MQEVIWQGELQWKENVKAPDGTPISSGNKTTHTVKCQAKASKASRYYFATQFQFGLFFQDLQLFQFTLQDAGQGGSEVQFQNWPTTLILQLIPKDLAQTIGSHFFKNSKSVLFHPEPSESLDALTKTLSSGYAGCVHFTGMANFKIHYLI